MSRIGCGGRVGEGRERLKAISPNGTRPSNIRTTMTPTIVLAILDTLRFTLTCALVAQVVFARSTRSVNDATP